MFVLECCFLSLCMRVLLRFFAQVQRLKPKRIAMEQQVKQVPKGWSCASLISVFLAPRLRLLCMHLPLSFSCLPLSVSPYLSFSAERALAAKELSNTGRLAQAFPGSTLSSTFFSRTLQQHRQHAFSTAFRSCSGQHTAHVHRRRRGRRRRNSGIKNRGISTSRCRWRPSAFASPWRRRQGGQR